MVINKKTPNIDGYKIHSADGELILGISSFDTETCEADMLLLADAKLVSTRLPDGTEHMQVKGTGTTVKRMKLEGAYATFRGQRV